MENKRDQTPRGPACSVLDSFTPRVLPDHLLNARQSAPSKQPLCKDFNI